MTSDRVDDGLPDGEPMELLTYEQAAAVLNIPIGTLRYLVCRKAIAHVRVSARNVRFSKPALQAFVASRAVEPASNGGLL